MALSLGAMAEKGRRKLSAKGEIMKSNWNAMKSIMKNHYSALPFGPNTTAAYNAGIDAAEYRTPDANKWAENWQAKVSK
ncbi:MAG: hypothetical protein ACOC5T_02610 [Elusimicrobiota bacterium]